MRAIRYVRPPAPVQPAPEAIDVPPGTTPPAKPRTPSAGEPTQEEIDGYLERLLKYVPAEIVTLFIALAGFAALRETSPMLWAATIGAIVLTPLYLYATSRSLPEKERPHWVIYVLSPIAFVIWALYMNEAVRSVTSIKVDQGWATFLLVVGVFAIPLIDMAVTGAPRKLQAT